MPNPFTALNPRGRFYVYVLYGFAVVAVGCVDVWYDTADPEWLGRVQRVLIYLSPLISVLAVSNIKQTPDAVVEYRDDDVAIWDNVNPEGEPR